MTSVLVAYTSKYNATAEIAERIAATLTAAGLDVTRQQAEAVGDVGGYDAVVLGSAVYAGH